MPEPGTFSSTSHPAPWTIKHCGDHEGCDRYVVMDHIGNRVTESCVDYGAAATSANGVNVLHRENEAGVA